MFPAKKATFAALILFMLSSVPAFSWPLGVGISSYCSF